MHAAAQLPDHHLQLFNYSVGIRPGNYVALSRDNRGFLWILYPRSIQRFDGKNITEFPLHGAFQHLHTDPKGNIWASSATQVLCFSDDLGGFQPVPVTRNDSTHALGTVFNGYGGALYLFSAEGLHAFDETTRRFLKATPLQTDYPLHASDLFGIRDNSLFFRAGSFVYRFDMQDQSVERLADRNGFRLHAVSGKKALVSTWENDTWIYDFSGDTVLPLQLPAPYRETSGNTLSIRSVARTSPGRYLLAAREGIFTYQPEGDHFQKLSFYQDGRPVVTNDYCQQVYLDQERNIWMLTVAGIARFSLDHPAPGLIRIPQPVNLPPGSVSNVRQIAEDKDGNFWMATGNGFVEWRKQDGEWIHHAAEAGAVHRLAHPSIRGIAYDGKHVILGPTNFGAWIFDPGSGRYHRPAYAHDSVRTYSQRDFFDDITPLRRGDFLLLGRDALYLLDGKTYRLSILETPASHLNTNRAFERPDGLVWIATMKGLYLVDSAFRQISSLRPDGPDPSLWTGFLRQDGSLLFPSTEGLYIAQWDGTTILSRKLSGLFEDSFLNSVCEDSAGTIWASSERGIYRFEPSSRELHLLDYSDNIQGYGFNGNGPFRSSDGILFWSGQHGINYMRPEQFVPGANPLHVYIQNVRIGQEDSLLSSTGDITMIPYDKRSIEVEILAPYFNNPDKVKYRYRISGLDEDWKNIGNNNRLRLTRIPPGTYEPQVQGTLDNVHWSDAEIPFRFRVTAPYWQQAWFITTCFAVLALALWSWIRSRNQRIERRQQEEREKIDYRRRIADAEMQALRAQMNPHFIFNCLNSINRYIIKNDQDTASLYLTRFAKLIRLILDNSNNRTVSLQQELEALRLYIDMESIRFE